VRPLRVAAVAILPALVACVASSSPSYTAAASFSGGSAETVRSAALLTAGTVTDGALGTLTTYVQFFDDAPGAACSTLDASTVVTAGSLAVPLPPTSLQGKTLTFGTSADAILSLNALPGGDASPDAGYSDTLVAVGGTVKFGVSGGDLTGTIDAQMVLGSSPGSAPVHVTGTFVAPACGDQ
jgi:hypothetical protein